MGYFSGGLEAVTFTDILQVSIMLIGAIVLTILGIYIISYTHIQIIATIADLIITVQKPQRVEVHFAIFNYL